MKKLKGFTLVELLVVISIIALLLAILIPSLNKAKETANRILCGNHMKTMGMANSAYSSVYNGYFCPIAFHEPNTAAPASGYVDAGYISRSWVVNLEFRKTLNLGSYGKSLKSSGYDGRDSQAERSAYAMPKEFLCPSDKISQDVANMTETVLISYAYNMTDWYQPGLSWGEQFKKQKNIGHKISNLTKSPAAALAFIDGIDWWTNWIRGGNGKSAADYTASDGWDKHGQQSNNTYRLTYGIYGAVFYRHSEGAEIGFYDGHASYMKKEKIFDPAKYQFPNSTILNPGMWVGNENRFYRYNPPRP